MTNAHKIHMFNEQINALENILVEVQKGQTYAQKIHSLDKITRVQELFPLIDKLAKEFALDEQGVFLLKSVGAIGQAETVFGLREKASDFDPGLFTLFMNMLRDMETTYRTIGGIVGYHVTVLKLLVSKYGGCDSPNNVSYEEPEGMDLSSNEYEVRQAVRWGIENMGRAGEIYPIGGAGDRLNLKDEHTGEPLPAAQLQFCGRSLLEGMIRDLQAREHLHYRLLNKQTTVPIALMTSHEKNNHDQMLKICQQSGWFGRPEESFRFFVQPLVPVVTIEGHWAMHESLKPILKPGGHGVMWKAAIDAGVFDWLESLGCYQVLIRQINNPVAGVDNGLSALLGIGCHHNKSFGFASCARVVNTAEGMNVVKQTKIADGDSTAYESSITNIEYVDFACLGIEDVPVSPDTNFSRFPSNTNVLFADLTAVRKAVSVCPIPGMLLNMKSKVICNEGHGSKPVAAGRLESLMQNIADYIVDRSDRPLRRGESADLHTFLTYNKRHKTISVTKQAYKAGEPMLGTPEGCFYEMMLNYRELLESFCCIELPPLESEKEYLETGPAFLALFHPAIGPLYEIISKKINGGRLAKGAELIIEAAEVDIRDLDLEGSLLVEAEAVLGKKNELGLSVYDAEACGKCSLHRVMVRNKGINRAERNIFWKMAVQRSECVHIRLHGNAEFFAHDVILEGGHIFEVPEGHRLEVFQCDGEVRSYLKRIEQATWRWNYTFGDEDSVVISKELRSGDQDDAEGCCCC